MPTPVTTPADTLFGAIGLIYKDLVKIAKDVFDPFATTDTPAQLQAREKEIAQMWQVVLTVLPYAVAEPIKTLQTALGDVSTGTFGEVASTAGALYFNTLSQVLELYRTNLIANKQTDPSTIDTATVAALKQASYLGVGSRVVTTLFELFLPKNMNVFNWIGPWLAQLAGFDQIFAADRGPQIQHAIGNLAQYRAASDYLTVAPPAFNAAQLFARGLISAEQRDRLLSWGGLMAEFQPSVQQGAYRPVQPFLLARMANSGVIPLTDVRTLLQFAGFRATDIDLLLKGFAALALQPYQQQYLVASVRSAELGTITPEELADDMNFIGLNQQQQGLVQLTVSTRKLEQLAELYRKSISEAYGYGTLTDEQYIPALEAIGISAADAEAHYAIDSAKKNGKAFVAAQKAALKVQNQRNRAAENAAIAGFKNGTLNAEELSAALIAAGMDPLVAGYTVAIQQAKLAGNLVYIYGVQLPRQQAVVLREKVAALGKQVTAQLVTPDDALTELTALNIPPQNAKALVADWAATHTAAADVGVKLPI